MRKMGTNGNVWFKKKLGSYLCKRGGGLFKKILLGKINIMRFIIKGEDSTTVMFAGNNTETNSTLENM